MTPRAAVAPGSLWALMLMPASDARPEQADPHAAGDLVVGWCGHDVGRQQGHQE